MLVGTPIPVPTPAGGLSLPATQAVILSPQPSNKQRVFQKGLPLALPLSVRIRQLQDRSRLRIQVRYPDGRCLLMTPASSHHRATGANESIVDTTCFVSNDAVASGECQSWPRSWFKPRTLRFRFAHHFPLRHRPSARPPRGACLVADLPGHSVLCVNTMHRCIPDHDLGGRGGANRRAAGPNPERRHCRRPEWQHPVLFDIQATALVRVAKRAETCHVKVLFCIWALPPTRSQENQKKVLQKKFLQAALMDPWIRAAS